MINFDVMRRQMKADYEWREALANKSYEEIGIKKELRERFSIGISGGGWSHFPIKVHIKDKETNKEIILEPHYFTEKYDYNYAKKEINHILRKEKIEKLLNSK